MLWYPVACSPPPASDHWAPPSTASRAPVVKLEASLAKYRTAAAISFGAPERKGPRSLREGLAVPVARDVGPERTRQHGVHTHLGTKSVCKSDRQGVQTGLRRRVGEDVVRRPNGADRARVDDRPALTRNHSLADERREAEGALQIDTERLVPELLGDGPRIRVGRGETGI